MGSFGDVSYFSMQSSKLMPGGEGGILVTNNREYYERAVVLGHYATNQKSGPAYARFATGLGFKYRVHPLAAAIGLCQLRKLARHNRTRNSNCERFHRGLRKLKLWDVMETPAHVERVYFENWQAWKPESAPGVSKERFIAALVAEGCRVNDARYNLMHQQEIFTDPKVYTRNGILPIFAKLAKKPIYRGDELPISEAHRQKLVWLPTFPNGTREDVDRYLAAFKKVEDNMDELRR